MPSYEFRCKNCKVGYLEDKPIDQDPPEPVCHLCKHPMTRIYNFGAVTFKGTGFYRTDK